MMRTLSAQSRLCFLTYFLIRVLLTLLHFLQPYPEISSQDTILTNPLTGLCMFVLMLQSHPRWWQPLA